MYKGKEWLESVITKELMTNSGNPDMTTYEQGRVSVLKYYLKLINQLDEPEITEEQALNKLAESYPFSADGINGILQAQLAGYSPVSTVKFIQPKEPELPELPVIPQFVADWIEEAKGRHHSLYQAMKDYCDPEVNQWIQGFFHSDTFARAWIDGYTIEKVKRYRVQLPDAESNASSNLLGLMKTGDSRIVICKIKFSSFLYSDNVRLTEQEIKRNHEYLWTFAEEVPNV